MNQIAYNQKLQGYALYTKALQDVMVLKRGTGFNRNSNLNKAVKKLDTLQKDLISNSIDNFINDTGKTINTKKVIDEVVGNTLNHQTKSYHNLNDELNINNSVVKNINDYSDILTNRISKEQSKIDNRINEEINKINKYKVNDKELIKYLENNLLGSKPYNIKLVDRFGRKIKDPYKYTSFQLQLMGANYQRIPTKQAKKFRSISNIVRDALHTNQSTIELSNALANGYAYKVWNNGRSKTRVRPWHRAKLIQSVSIDDTFEIYGSYPANMMYPGDLAGGAENVANCRCWLSFTNDRPSDFKTKGSSIIPIGSTSRTINTNSFNHNTKATTQTKHNSIKSTISTKVKQVKNKITSKIYNLKTKLNPSKFKNKENIANYKNYAEDFINNYANTKKELMNKYPVPKDLINEEIKFIKTWWLDSTELVYYLRNTSKIKKSSYFEQYHKLLNSALNKYNIKENSVLHRRVKKDFFIADEGQIGEFDTPTSTTFNPQGNIGFGEFHITVLAPKGTKGAYLEGVINKNLNKDKLNEWLLPAGTKYKTLIKDYETKEAVILII